MAIGPSKKAENGETLAHTCLLRGEKVVSNIVEGLNNSVDCFQSIPQKSKRAFVGLLFEEAIFARLDNI